MKQKSEFSVIGRAMTTVAGFDRVYRSLEQQVTLRGQAKSTFENYIHRIAQVSLHFNRLPEEVTAEELNGYLVSLAVSAVSPSRSAFKHSVYGLRYYYRYVGLSDRAIKLPSLKKDAKLPTIFNKSELLSAHRNQNGTYRPTYRASSLQMSQVQNREHDSRRNPAAHSFARQCV